MPTAKGVHKPRYNLAVRELAVSLYVANLSTTLRDVANQLNNLHHFDPPLSYDSVGRWVEAKGVMKSKHQQVINRLIIRRSRYGSKGISESAIEKLSSWRRTLWADPNYKLDMQTRMRKFAKPLRLEIARMYQEGKTPTEIRRLLRSRNVEVPCLAVIHKILNDHHILKRQKSLPLPFERPKACPVCSSMKIKRYGYRCNLLGIKLEPRFQCLTCGTTFYKDRVCIKQKYPSYVREFALACHSNKLTCGETSKAIDSEFGVYVNPTTIRLWRVCEMGVD